MTNDAREATISWHDDGGHYDSIDAAIPDTFLRCLIEAFLKINETGDDPTLVQEALVRFVAGSTLTHRCSCGAAFDGQGQVFPAYKPGLTPRAHVDHAVLAQDSDLSSPHNIYPA